MHCHHSYRPCNHYQTKEEMIRLQKIMPITGDSGSAGVITVDANNQEEIQIIGKDVTYQCVVMIVYIVYLPQECQQMQRHDWT